MFFVKVFFSAVFFALFFIAGCAVQTKISNPDHYEISTWRGRLAVRVGSLQQPSQVTSFAAGFELAGNTETGTLILFTPLGTTVATLAWSVDAASMRSNGEIRHFDSLGELIKQTVGTEVPVPALFAWLAGEDMKLAGWSADLSQRAQGRITARRVQPEPQAELRLVLENGN